MGERIAWAVRAPIVKTWVLQELNISAATLSRWIAGKNRIFAEDARKLCVATGVPVEWLLTGAVSSPVQAPDDKDVVWVPRLEVRASAGGGLVPVAPEIDQGSEIAFRSFWLRNLGVAPEDAQFINADGDSMEPTILNGDLLLINRRRATVVSNAIYVVSLSGSVQVKRLQPLFDGSLLLISDNPRYQPEKVDRTDVEQLQIEGRVRWYGRAI